MAGDDKILISLQFNWPVKLFSDDFKLGLDTSSESSSSSGGDETDLLSGGGVSGDTGRVSDVLVVTSSVGVLDWVHGHTSHDRPHLSLGLLGVVGSGGLQDGLLVPASAGHDADHGSGIPGHGLLHA